VCRPLLTIDVRDAIRTAQEIVRRSTVIKTDVIKHLADACEVHVRTVAKWGAGEAPIPEGQVEALTVGLATLGFGSAAVMREVADWLESAAEAMADGTVTPAEYERCRAEAHEIHVAMILADLCLARRAGR